MLIGLEDRGVLTKPKFAKGCEECFAGKKTVIFITGLCDDSCYYCPVNREKLYHDVMYANERRVRTIEEILYEIERSGSKSASITGGDPLIVPERTLHLIENLKSTYGPNFHIHLYTSGRYATPSLLRRLERAGLDEIRFHPTIKGLEKRIETAKKETSMSVGAEVPAIPGHEQQLLRLAIYLDGIKADFLNINEMEISESNSIFLLSKGFKPGPDGVAVRGSRETAFNVMRKAVELGLSLPIHFCPASFKEKIQTRNRYYRTIMADKRVYEEQTPYNTLIYGELDIESKQCANIISRLVDEGILYPGSHAREERAVFYYRVEDAKTIYEETRSCKPRLFIVESHPTMPRRTINRFPYHLI